MGGQFGLFKGTFIKGYLLLAAVTAIACLGQLFIFHHQPLVWLGVLTISSAPIINRLMPFDVKSVPHHKVRYPRVSLLVFCGLALVLIFIAERGIPLWLALANVGGFLLVAYWAED